MTYRSKHAGFWIAGSIAAGLLLVTACGKKEDDASTAAAGGGGAAAPPATASKNVPASAAEVGQGAQRMVYE